MDIEIASIGLATAQGSAAEILGGLPLEAPRAVPWPLRPGSECQVCRPARGYPDQLAGPDRWRALAQAALQECNPSPIRPGTPLIVASCNGGANSMDVAEWIDAFDTRRLLSGTPWAAKRLPVVSSSCASGLHALFLAAQLLTTETDEVVVLAVDILSRASHDNFEALRVLAPSPATPWQPASRGFIPGEAAVAVRATRSSKAGHPILAREPALGQDLDEGDGLREAVGVFGSRSHSVVVGQGTGPAAVDGIELSALDFCVERRTPVTTPQLYFGHSLGASGLLSLSLAALALQVGELPPTLGMPPGVTSNDRPLARETMPVNSALIVCRALSGACAATRVGSTNEPATPPRFISYRQQPAPEPIGHAVLRRINAEAPRVRPAVPPDMFFVRLEAPLVPAPAGSLGDRLLPHAVVEITPGAIPRAVARRWGYGGPTLCLVGEAEQDSEGAGDALARACRAAGRTVAQLRIRGTGYERELEWDVQSR